MNFRAHESQAELDDLARLRHRGGLFRKYVTLFVIIVCVALIVNGILGIWLFYHEQKQSLVRLQRQQVELAAVKISQFIKEIKKKYSNNCCKISYKRSHTQQTDPIYSGESTAAQYALSDCA